MNAATVSFTGVTKDFRLGWRGLRVRAVDDFSLEISEGQIFGLLGPNGSGKSSVLKIAAGVMNPSVGECFLNGHSARSTQHRVSVGYQPEQGGDYGHLTARESLEWFGNLSGLSRKAAEHRAQELLQVFELEDAANRAGQTYSKGMRQRLRIAQAIVHKPSLLIIDEPFSGLDPIAVRSLIGILKQLATERTTVLLTSHLTMRVEDVCDAVGLLYRGKLLVSGPIDDVIKSRGPELRGMDDLFTQLVERLDDQSSEQKGNRR